LIAIGLDISTANIGICLLQSSGDDISLLYTEGISLSKTKGLFAKAEFFRARLLDIKSKLSSDNLRVDVVVVEEPLQAFRRNMSSAATISKLNRFNGIISYITKSMLGVPLVMTNVVSTRKQIGLKIEKKAPKTTKEQVFDWVKKHDTMVGFEWPTRILKGGPNKGKVRYQEYCYDIADSFVVAYWGMKFLKIHSLDENNV